MAAADVQLSLSQSAQSTLDSLLRPHLRLEPMKPLEAAAEGTGDSITSPIDKTLESRLNESISSQKNVSLKKQLFGQQSAGQTSETGDRVVPKGSVVQGTIESDNKRRPVVLRRNASRYQPPSPEPPDPNSEAKSVTIRRMQSNLEEWDRKLQDICDKKAKNDSIQRSEISKRDGKIAEIAETFSAECELRRRTEQERNELEGALKRTEAELADYRQQVEQLQSDVAQYEVAYQELETNRNELEQEGLSVREQLEQSEGMRRRLNDQVTELQGQLAIEEQRSRFCVLL